MLFQSFHPLLFLSRSAHLDFLLKRNIKLRGEENVQEELLAGNAAVGKGKQRLELSKPELLVSAAEAGHSSGKKKMSNLSPTPYITFNFPPLLSLTTVASPARRPALLHLGSR